MDATRAGRRIRRARDRKAWTQQHLADAAALSVRTVQRAEDGTMSAETLSAIAGALGTDVERLSLPPYDGPVVQPVLFYAHDATLDWLADAFGVQIAVRYPSPEGGIHHAELDIGGGRIMVGGPVDGHGWTTPERAERATGAVYVLVPDADAHCERARARGAPILSEPTTTHGDRRYLAQDPEGHFWWFATRLGSEP